MLYMQHYIKTVHFWLKYNRRAIVRKTTKLIEGGHHGLQDYRHLCYYFYVFLRFLRFFKIQKVVTFYVFCRVSYVFSNYGERKGRGEGKGRGEQGRGRRWMLPSSHLHISLIVILLFKCCFVTVIDCIHCIHFLSSCILSVFACLFTIAI